MSLVTRAWWLRSLKDDLADGFDERGVEVSASQIGFADASLPHVAFQEQIVGGCGVVVPICFYTFAGECHLEAKFGCLGQDDVVNGDAVEADDDSLGGSAGHSKVPPPVPANILDAESLRRVNRKDSGE
ncbi:unnamed protein product [Sphagnum balticum]